MLQLTGAGVTGDGLLPHCSMVEWVLKARLLRKHVALVCYMQQGWRRGCRRQDSAAAQRHHPEQNSLEKALLPSLIPSALRSTSCGSPTSLISSLVLLFPGLLKPLQTASGQV